MTDYDPTLDPNKNQIRDYDGGQRQQDARYANIPPRPAMPTGALGDAPEGSLVPPALLRALQEYALLIEYAWMIDAEEKKRAAEYLSVIRRQADLNNLNKRVQRPVQAWCADYTAGLTGEVATLEVPGEVDPTIGGGLNIKPGDADAAAWNAAYGQIQMATVLTPAAFAWNFVMTVPWMKWRPLWRYATVVAVNGVADTLNLTLHPILSRTRVWLRRDLTINAPWESSMTGVAVEYMSCGAEAFEVGDEVIVEFREEGGGGLSFYEPYVIGFKQEPRECMPMLFAENVRTFAGFSATHRVFYISYSVSDDSVSYIPAPSITTVQGVGIRGVMATRDGGYIHNDLIHNDLIGLGQSVHRVDENGDTVWHTEIPEYDPSQRPDIMSIAYDAHQHQLLVADIGNGQTWILNPGNGTIIGLHPSPPEITPIGDSEPKLFGIAVDDRGNKIYAYGGIGNGAINIGGVVTPVTEYLADASQIAGVAWWRGNPWILLTREPEAGHIEPPQNVLLRLSPDGTSALNTYQLWREFDRQEQRMALGSGIVPA